MGSLVIQTSFIGDVILTTPLIAALAERGVVDVVTTPVGASVLRNNPFVRHLFVYDKKNDDSGVFGFLKFGIGTRGVVRGGRGWRQKSSPPAERSSALGCEILPPTPPTTHHSPDQRLDAYLAQGSLRSAGLAFLLGCDRRVGFGTSDGRALYTERVVYRDDWHHARRLLALAGYERAQEAGDDRLQPRVYPGESEISAVDELLRGRKRSFIALAPGSVWATKRWPYFSQLAGLLQDDFDLALIGGNDDSAAAQEINATIGPDRVIDATGKLSLLGSAELIRRAQLIVTNDSSPQHLASAVGTPTVTLFGPTVVEFGFGPLAPGSRSTGLATLPCRPCHRHGPQQCPLGHWKCMRDMTAEMVYDTVRSVIK